MSDGAVEEVDVLILGGGVCGLCAAGELGSRATVIERSERPGGLVRVEHRADWWFDHVIHLLHMPDVETEAWLRELLGDVLQPCPPEAYVETVAGTARYPLQLHLADLEPSWRAACVRDVERVACRAPARAPARAPRSYEDLLRDTFGQSLCELFYFPYNRKLWKRPLSELDPSGLQWNIARPTLDEIVRGAEGRTTTTGVYTANGWYPRPPPGAPIRGMEVLTRALAERASDLRTNHVVESIDLALREVVVVGPSSVTALRYQHCLSTIPLPVAIDRCLDAPADLRAAVRRLRWNRVRSVLLSLQGPRPTGPGLWRYTTDESVPFTRVVHQAEFDPLMAPADGWGLLVEVTERAEDPAAPPSSLVPLVVDGLTAIGTLDERSTIVDTTVLTIDPAYVVFTPETSSVAADAAAFLRSGGIESMGRYGAWEYSSMTKAMTDGRQFARSVGGAHERGGADP